MTLSRTAFYGVGGTLLVAYLATANMPAPSDDAPAPAPPQAAAARAADSIAAEVSAQAARLQERLKQAPVPETSPRNPFAFALRPLARASEARPAAAPEDAPALPAIPAPPALTLIGIAEEAIAQGVRRTAVITLGAQGDGNTLFMVTEGQAVGDRYRVTKIGADAIELEDLVTRAYRRLALR